MRLGDKEVEWDANFRLYLVTHLPNPAYSPETAGRTTLINCSVSEQARCLLSSRSQAGACKGGAAASGLVGAVQNRLSVDAVCTRSWRVAVCVRTYDLHVMSRTHDTPVTRLSGFWTTRSHASSFDA